MRLRETETGNRLTVHLGPSSQLEKRLGEGEAADVAILSRAGAEDLIARGKIVAGSLRDIARSSIGIAVQSGAPKPDMSSVADFKRALLAAKSIAERRFTPAVAKLAWVAATEPWMLMPRQASSMTKTAKPSRRASSAE